MVVMMNNEFIERFIFENEKDTPFGNSSEFYKMLKDKYNIDRIPDLYKKIVNYQLDYYGKTLINSKYVENKTKEDCKHERKKSLSTFTLEKEV